MTSSVFDRAPVVETARLRLRAHTAADFDACLPMWNDPIVTRFIGGRAYTGEEVWQRIQRYAGSWALLGHGFWVIEDKATGRLIGEIGLMDAKRDIDPAITDPEAGWAFASHAHGKGIATEAVARVLAWADTSLAAPRLVCMIEDGNAASTRVAEKFAFAPYAHTLYAEAPVTLYRRERP